MAAAMSQARPDFRVASLLDTRLIELARSEAARLLEDDPDLTKPEHALAQMAARLSQEVTGKVHEPRPQERKRHAEIVTWRLCSAILTAKYVEAS